MDRKENKTMKTQHQVCRFVYSVVKHLGTQAAHSIGTLPKNFIPTRCQVITETPIVGGGASVAVGNVDSTNAWLTAKAITNFDTLGKSQSAVIDNAAICDTTNRRTVVVIPSAADLTVGNLEIVISGFVPVLDHTTLVGA